ncbi:MAG TPA: hypothetical protein VFA12_20030 [Stellaceae bacterium]|nr:hypothetical protein [Stellaceae bacterium]
MKRLAPLVALVLLGSPAAAQAPATPQAPLPPGPCEAHPGAGAYQATAQGAVVFLATGAVIPNAPDNPMWRCYQEWLAAGNQPVPAPAAPVTKIVSRSVFLSLFTTAELVAISGAARTNDAVNVWLITAEAADSIDLAAAKTKAGLDALVAAALLTGAREAAILAGQPPA